MYITFDTEVAGKIGLNAAVLLSNLSYWVKRNAANEVNFRDGHYWTFNSVRAFCELFPFWTRNVIYKTLKALEDDGYILSACYNKEGTDRTKWYTVTQKAYDMMADCISPKGESHFSSGRNGFLPEQKTTNIQKRTDKGEQTKGAHENVRSGEEPAAPSSPSRTRRTGWHVSCPFINPSPELAAAWCGFEEMRHSMRKTLTQRAADLIAKKLQQLAPDDDRKKAAILDQSVAGGWQGVYPLKAGEGVRGGKGYAQTQTVEEMYEEAQEILRNGGGIL